MLDTEEIRLFSLGEMRKNFFMHTLQFRQWLNRKPEAKRSRLNDKVGGTRGTEPVFCMNVHNIYKEDITVCCFHIFD